MRKAIFGFYYMCLRDDKYSKNIIGDSAVTCDEIGSCVNFSEKR